MDYTSFVLYQEYEQYLSFLSDEEAGQLFRALFIFSKGEKPDIKSPAVGIAYTAITNQMTRDREKYEKKVQANRENGKKGGRPAKDTSESLGQEKGAREPEKKPVYPSKTSPDNQGAPNVWTEKPKETQGNPKKPKETQGNPTKPLMSNESCVMNNDLKTHTLTLSHEKGGLSGLPVEDDAREAHKSVVEWLEKQGYSCVNEYKVENRGDGRCGYIDIVAEKNGDRVAIEVDRKTPREKSISKLQQFPGARFVALRDPDPTTITDQVDGVGIIRLSKTNNLQESRFEAWWVEYPKKAGKQAARKAWHKIKPDAALYSRIVDATRAQRTSFQWRKENGQFIPDPSKWLNQGRWDDDLAALNAGGKAIGNRDFAGHVAEDYDALEE